MKHRFIQEMLVGSITVAVLLVAGSASAQPASGAQNFGTHVSRCAREMGIDATHNPGRHRGAAGWTACQG